MIPLPNHYPLALASTSTLLDWAHRQNPPFAAIRIVTGWLKRDEEIRSYLDGIVRGNIYRWQFGYLIDETTQ